MAPTILVARVAVKSSNSTVTSATITHISGLDFGSERGMRSDQIHTRARGDGISLVNSSNGEPGHQAPLVEKSMQGDQSADNRV